MNDDLPDFLQVPPASPAPSELRARVLTAVERELTRRRKPRWERAIEWSVAASLLIGVGLSFWRWQLDETSRVVQPDFVQTSADKASELVGKASDVTTNRMAARHVKSAWSADSRVGDTPYERYLNSWTRVLEENHP